MTLLLRTFLRSEGEYAGDLEREWGDDREVGERDRERESDLDRDLDLEWDPDLDLDRDLDLDFDLEVVKDLREELDRSAKIGKLMHHYPKLKSESITV